MKKIISITFALIIAIVSAYAQSSFDLRYDEATSHYLKGEYQSAITLLQRALSFDNLTKEQKSQANRLLNQCQQEIEASKKLIVGRKNFDNLSYTGGTDSTYITVASKKAWHIVSSPSWVTARVKDDMIYFTIAENTSHEVRTGAIEITLDKTSTTYINFSQNKRPITPQTLNIYTEPRTVQLLVDNTMNTSPMKVSLTPGEHHIHARRNQFESIDTTIVIKDEVTEQETDLTLNLKRKFATVTINIVSEHGTNSVLTNPMLTIDGKMVDLHPYIEGDYNDLKPIEFYTLYSNGSIPVPAGTHMIKIVTPNYEDSEYVLKNAENDLDYTVTIMLSPKLGALKVNDINEAYGAEIYIDGVKQEGVMVPCDSLSVTTGSHIVTFKKEGMISAATQYPINITEKKIAAIDLEMIACDTYTFAAPLPDYATIYIDSVEIGRTPFKTSLTKGVHHIEIRKAGHLTLTDVINVAGLNNNIIYEGEMPETRPFTIKADEKYLNILITQDDKTISSGNLTPSTIEIPLSKKKYKLKLLRETNNKQKIAYKSSFRFDKPEKNSLNIQSWSDHILQIIDAQYYITGDPIGVYNKSFRQLGEANLFKFQIFKGLSTSVAKGKVFLSTDNEDMRLTENVKLPGSLCKVLPAFSFLLVNEEFRLGGALFSYMDADILLSYAWYPNMHKFLPLSHVSGHDVFGGIEISSRFPIATVTIRFGYEKLFNGKANIYSENIGQHKGNTEDKFVSTPIDLGQLQLGIGISIGGLKSKGNNILRIF